MLQNLAVESGLIFALCVCSLCVVIKIVRKRRKAARLASCIVKVPAYWKNVKKAPVISNSKEDVAFDDMYPVAIHNRNILQAFLDKTNSNTETTLRLVRAVRVESSELWVRYQKKVAAVEDKRGDCVFAGQGPPVTAEILESVEKDKGWKGGLIHELNSDVCEAYLWHGTRPQVALRIAEDGFRVDHKSRAGKRFGPGGYFAEDPAKADDYAGAGEGIFEDCYAMLLCRVILGRQFLTNKFKFEDATDQAQKHHDSTLAEPSGGVSREFIVFNDEQVYPEYALVYERRGPDRPELSKHIVAYWASQDGSCMRQSVPGYWFNAPGEDEQHFFHDTYPAEKMHSIIQAMVDSTTTNEAVHGLNVLKVLRMEDSKMWSDYIRQQRAIQESRQKCTPCDVGTLHALEESNESKRLAADVNEVYLWHGSSPEVGMRIAEKGNPVKLSGGPHGMIFGDGAYFTARASIADVHSECEDEGYYAGQYTMLLCRVTLGEVQVLSDADREAHKRVGSTFGFDSTSGVCPSAGVLRREFVVPNHAQIYPEYVVLYERLAASPVSKPHLYLTSESRLTLKNLPGVGPPRASAQVILNRGDNDYQRILLLPADANDPDEV